MAHRIYPVLRGLALGLTLLALPAAAAQSGAPEYSGAGASGLANLPPVSFTSNKDPLVRAIRGKSPERQPQTDRDFPRGGLAFHGVPARSAQGQGRLLMAQAAGQTGSNASGDSRTQLRMELERIRQQNGGAAAPAGSSSFAPPPPAKKKPGQPVTEAENAPRPQTLPAAPADPKVDRLTGQLLLFSFRGNSPVDPGTRTVRALLQSGVIAGVVLGKENILGRGQLKEMMKFLASAGGTSRPFLAIREIGGASEAFPAVKDFELWPSEQDVATKGDPQYAYSTYRSMGATLASFGFNTNFGPTLAASGNGTDLAASFGSNPLQTGVFAKTFLLGHKEENVLAVPVVDSSAHSVRALKTILVSDPSIPVSSVMKEGSGIAPFAAYAGLGNGARFCFATTAAASAGTDIVSGFKRGCDVLILDSGADSPATVRDQAALGLGKAIQVGELSFDALNAAAARASELRHASQGEWAATAARAR